MLTLIYPLLLLGAHMIEARQTESERFARACGRNADDISAGQGIWPRDSLDWGGLLEILGGVQQLLGQT